MNYETYRVTKTKKEFFSTWTKEDLDNLNAEHKNEIYQKYFIKAMVFQRDNFKCKNENCKSPNSKLTLHHTKFQKNNGKWSLKNCVTICKSCHTKYHRGKDSLTYDGMTYKVHKNDYETNWKQIKAQKRQFRKTIKREHGVVISWALMAKLMKFLFDNNIDLDSLDDDQ